MTRFSGKSILKRFETSDWVRHLSRWCPLTLVGRFKVGVLTYIFY